MQKPTQSHKILTFWIARLERRRGVYLVLFQGADSFLQPLDTAVQVDDVNIMRRQGSRQRPQSNFNIAHFPHHQIEHTRRIFTQFLQLLFRSRLVEAVFDHHRQIFNFYLFFLHDFMLDLRNVFVKSHGGYYLNSLNY